MGNHVAYNPNTPEPLNSFFLNLVCGNSPYENSTPEGLYRNILSPWWHMTQYEFLKGPSFLSGNILKVKCASASERRLMQTHEEFFGEIDRTIIEVGLTVEEVARVVNVYLRERYRGTFDERESRARVLDEYLFPIFVALRRKGYNAADLHGEYGVYSAL